MGWYETGLFLRHYHLGIHRIFPYSGIVSPKFGEKTKLTGRRFLNFIRENPGYDVYFVNPFPCNAYYAFNVWDHGEICHPGLMSITAELFERAEIGWDIHAQGRNAHDTLLYCNYWVGNAGFWERYIDLVLKLVAVIKTLPERSRARLYELDPRYPVPTPLLPFIFERLFSTLLLMDRSIRALAYPHSRPYILTSTPNPDEILIMESFMDVIDEIDRRGQYTEADRDVFRRVRQLKLRMMDVFHLVQ